MAAAVVSPELASGAEPDPADARIHVPRLELVYECEATISDVIPFGETSEGVRRVIPITGGVFRGPRVSGTVVPGGADWNLSRNDGAGSVEAAYYLKTDDGVVLRITNRGVGRGEPRKLAGGEILYMYTIPTFEAPKGKYEWMNSAVFVGTLGTRDGMKGAVLIRVFQLV